MRIHRRLVLLVACLVLVPLLPASGAQLAPDVRLSELIPAVKTAVRKVEALRPEVEGVRVALISSGVEARVFPEPARSRIKHARSDAVGLGTFAASQLMQLGAGVEISSLNVYADGKVRPDALEHALAWAATHAEQLDVVMLGFPSHATLDPVSAAMSDGTWPLVLDAMGEAPTRTEDGLVFGLPVEGAALSRKLAALPAPKRAAVSAFLDATRRWERLRASLSKLDTAGLSVVAPAGDLGDAPQTIFGLAGLREVITVGGSASGRPSPLSGSGPAMDGSVKPDLVAPTGIAGLLPETSVLAKDLETVIDPDLEVRGLGGEPATKARAVVDTSLASAASVSMAAGALRREGIEDAAHQRGALMAAAVPIEGVEVWRQGAGELRGTPSADFARSRPLAGGNADLGVEPAEGAWETVVGFSGRSPLSATTTLTDFAGTDAAGGTRTASASSAPPAAASVTQEGIRIAAPAGDSSFEGGVYCGYTEVALPVAGGRLDPSVAIDGVPADVEHVPTCLVKGARIRAFGFYIHDLPAEDLTFSLLPALPPEASLVHKPLTILPVDPLDTRLYTEVTDGAGYAYFDNVVPGYYTVRLFSDYGAPISQRVANPVTKVLRTVNLDVGENPSYQDFDALILGATGWTEADLRSRFGDDNVEADKPTASHWVTIAGRRTRVVLGSFKKMPGVAVSSRYVDLLDAKDFSFTSAAVADGLGLGGAADALPAARAVRGWSFVGQGTGTKGVFNPALAAADPGAVLGVGAYPFNLTTPNYKAGMSLNFSYRVRNAAIVALVKIGDEVAAGVVTPNGTIQAPALGLGSPLGDLPRVDASADGLASFDFDLTPAGASTGTLYLILVPSRPVQQLAAPLATAEVDDLSFSLDTWQRVDWPATLNAGHGMGHLFSVRPNYSHRQMSAPGCRQLASGGASARVCEDWRVFVHSPGDDAATVDVEAVVDGRRRSIRDAISRDGGVYADPRRGTSDFSSTFVFRLPSAGAPVEGAFRADNAFRTNGRFWEQLLLTKPLLAAYPGPLFVEILDNVAGRSSGIAPHVRGGVPVGPYVAFEPEARVVGDQPLGEAPGQLGEVLGR